MRRPSRTALTLVAVVGAAVCLSGAAAAGDKTPPPPIVITPGDSTGRTAPPQIDVGVSVPGQPGRRESQTTGAAGEEPACHWVPAPDVEAWLRRLPTRLPAPGVDPVSPLNRLFQQVCGGLVVDYVWFGPAVTRGVAAFPSPAELARQAYGELRLPVPVPGRSPSLRLADGRSAVLVGEHTWIWTDRATFAPRSRTVRVGPVWATVTARPVVLSFDPGTGQPGISCVGAGTRWVPGRYGLHEPSPTCDLVMTRSSAGRPGGVATATWAIRWQVTWTGAAGGRAQAGALADMTSRTEVVLAVAEGQALITGW